MANSGNDLKAFIGNSRLLLGIVVTVLSVGCSLLTQYFTRDNVQNESILRNTMMIDAMQKQVDAIQTRLDQHVIVIDSRLNAIERSITRIETLLEQRVKAEQAVFKSVP